MRWLPFLLIVAACRISPAGLPPDLSGRPVRVVATTGIVADLVRQIGGPRVEVAALMGPGVDPHLYHASEGDVERLAAADLVVYNGLHLEGRMDELFARMREVGRRTVAVTSGLPEDSLRATTEFGGDHDPHVWFDVRLWRRAAATTAGALAALDTAHAAGYAERLATYEARLDSLDAWVRTQVATIAPERRVLVSAHDAFGYFGRAYGVAVEGLQGVSTASEAGTADVQALAAFIAGRRLPAVFVESSVSPRAIEAVKAAVEARGHAVRIGGSLYSDALGSPGSGADTYEGMVRANVRTLVEALREAPVSPL